MMICICCNCICQYHVFTPQGAQEMDPKSSELVAETKQTVVQLKEQLDSQVSLVKKQEMDGCCFII